MPLDTAEQMFCKLALKNQLITQEALDQAISATEANGVSLPEHLRANKVIKSEHIDQIVKAIENHGEKFTKPKTAQTQETAQAKSSEPVAQVEMDLPDVEAETKSEPIIEGSKEKKPKPNESEFFEDEGLIPSPKADPKGLGVKLVEFLSTARDMGASDFHIVVNAPPFVRKYNTVERLSDQNITVGQAEQMLFGILSEEQQATLKSELGLDFCLIAPDDTRYRASIIKGSNGWSGTFRIVEPEPPAFESLGLPPAVKRLTDYAQGLVLVTGPKGSGKTTTLAAMIDLINTNRGEHVITVEDPIEYVHKSKHCQITQRALRVNTMSYANALRGALREDPDIILVGELRDLPTISASITAAETGHLVLASLHTTSAIRTVDRIIDAFPAKQQTQIRVMLAESIRGVVSQILLPRKDGNGVVMGLEVLLNNISVRKNIIEGKTFQLDNIMQTSIRQGMIRMDDSIKELYEKDLITLDIAKEFAREPGKIAGGGEEETDG